MKLKSYIKKGLLFYPILFVVPIFILIYQNSREHIIAKNSNIVTYTDVKNNSGNSEIITFNNSQDTISYSFILREGFAWPFTGYSFLYQEQFLDASRFDKIKFTLHTNLPKFRIIIKTFVDGYTIKEKFRTYLFLSKDMTVNSSGEYTIHLNEFSVPTWWYEMDKNYKPTYAGKPDFTKVNAIEFTTYPEDNQLGYTYNVRMSGLRLVKTFNKNILLVLIPFLLYYAALFLYKQYKIKKTFEKFVSSDIINKLMKSSNHIALGGEEKEVSILFADIQSFTEFSEKNIPIKVMERLNSYFSEMSEIIYRNHGIVDKYMGDGIMAVFEDSKSSNDHAYRACVAGTEMLMKIDELTKEWNRLNLDAFKIGIGINSGTAVVGNLGSSQVMNYTVIGDTVNVASRIEALTRQYPTNMLISENTYDVVKDKIDARCIDEVIVRGKSVPVKIYEVFYLSQEEN